MRKEKKYHQVSVKFPIVAKMFLVITSTLLVSFGIIIMMSHYFIYTNIKNTQETNNRVLNNKAAALAETSFDAIYTATQYLMSALKNPDYKIDWSVNGNIAAVYSSKIDGKDFEWSLKNNTFFMNNNCSPDGINSFFREQTVDIYRESSEDVVVFDAARYFEGLPILVMRIRTNGMFFFGFFGAEEMAASFSANANMSIMLNSFGEPLILSSVDDYKNGLLFTAQRLVDNLHNLGKKTGGYINVGEKGFFAVQDISAGQNNKHRSKIAAVITFVGQDIVFESINNTTLRNIYLAAGVWFMSIIIIWFFSLGITTPLLKLNSVSSRIEDGEYEIKLKITSKDETGLLTETMNNLTTALGNFEKFTNRTIARLARQSILPLGGENKTATFFFSDIRSFTAISEKMTPAEVVTFLNDYMERMVACVFATGGAIDKFIGDAVMAHWGAVETSGSPESDAVNGVTSALLMRASLACFNADRGQDPSKPIIKIGCGLNSGTVVAGLVGTEEKLEYTVIGDAVSFADRCETFNKAYGSEIVISEHTYNLLGDKFIVQEMKTVSEKNEYVKTFAVVNIQDSELLEKVFSEYLGTIPKMNLIIAAKCLGPTGPKTLDDVRLLLNIPSVDLSTVNVDEGEKKYTVADATERQSKVADVTERQSKVADVTERQSKVVK